MAVHQPLTPFKKDSELIVRGIMRNNNLTESGVPMILVILIKVCLNEAYSKIWTRNRQILSQLKIV